VYEDHKLKAKFYNTSDSQHMCDLVVYFDCDVGSVNCFVETVAIIDIQEIECEGTADAYQLSDEKQYTSVSTSDDAQSDYQSNARWNRELYSSG
jgi:hypothetical protein